MSDNSRSIILLGVVIILGVSAIASNKQGENYIIPLSILFGTVAALLIFAILHTKESQKSLPGIVKKNHLVTSKKMEYQNDENQNLPEPEDVGIDLPML